MNIFLSINCSVCLMLVVCVFLWHFMLSNCVKIRVCKHKAFHGLFKPVTISTLSVQTIGV